QHEGFAACQHLYMCVSTMTRRMPPDQAGRLWDVVRSAVREALADLQQMTDGDAAFQRVPRRQWLEDFTAISNYLPRVASSSPAAAAGPRPGSPPPALARPPPAPATPAPTAPAPPPPP